MTEVERKERKKHNGYVFMSDNQLANSIFAFSEHAQLSILLCQCCQRAILTGINDHAQLQVKNGPNSPFLNYGLGTRNGARCRQSVLQVKCEGFQMCF